MRKLPLLCRLLERYSTAVIAKFKGEISMNTKIKKIIVILTSVITAVIILGTIFLGIFDKKYTLYTRPMPGATAIDGESYITFADIYITSFYTFFLHYKNPADVQLNYGALDIVDYYSVTCGFVGSGTKLDCDVVETNKNEAVLHYSGVGVDKDGVTTNVDDYWSVNMNDLWNGKYTNVSIIE